MAVFLVLAIFVLLLLLIAGLALLPFVLAAGLIVWGARLILQAQSKKDTSPVGWVLLVFGMLVVAWLFVGDSGDVVTVHYERAYHYYYSDGFSGPNGFDGPNGYDNPERPSRD